MRPNKTKFISPGDIEGKINRKHNYLLALIRKNPGISRRDCAIRMGVSTYNISQAVLLLIAKGMILEKKSEPAKKDRGRPSTPLYLNKEYQYFAGIDIEAIQWRFVIIDFTGNIVFSQISSFQKCRSRVGYIEQLESLLRKSINTAGTLWEKVDSIGIGAPGFFNQKTGIIESYTVLPNFEKIPVLDICRKISKKPSFITHNIFNLVTYALWKKNTNQKKITETTVHVAIRSGISIAFNVEDRIYCGSNCRAGEMGLFMVNSKPLQKIAGISALKKLLPNLNDNFWHGDINAIKNAYRKKEVKFIIDQAMDDIALCLANVAVLLDNDEIVVYSTIFPSENIIWEKLYSSFKKYRSAQKLKNIKFICGSNSELNVACGAALHALEQRYKTRKAQEAMT